MYGDTNRYLRGRVPARPHEGAKAGGLPLPKLARQLREDVADVEPVRLKAVVESLERDGLVRVTDASENPEYTARPMPLRRRGYPTRPQQQDRGESQVSLP